MGRLPCISKRTGSWTPVKNRLSVRISSRLAAAFIHHGIYVGACKVIHYAGLSARPASRAGGRGLARMLRAGPTRSGWRQHASSAFDLLEIVRRARSRLGENGYRLLTNNCEHFCEWCLRGVPRSLQVEELGAPVRAMLTLLRRTAAAPHP